jgi:hypothetical protein
MQLAEVSPPTSSDLSSATQGLLHSLQLVGERTSELLGSHFRLDLAGGPCLAQLKVPLP